MRFVVSLTCCAALMGCAALAPAAHAAEAFRDKTVIIERKGECSNAPAAVARTTMSGQLRFYFSGERIYQSFSSDSIKILPYVPDGREHVIQAREDNRRFPVTTQASFDGRLLTASYRYDLDGVAYRTTRQASYQVEVDAAAGQCRVRTDEFSWRQVQKNGTLFRDSRCQVTTSTCSIVSGRK
jgi:hypothetical protein